MHFLELMMSQLSGFAVCGKVCEQPTAVNQICHPLSSLEVTPMLPPPIERLRAFRTLVLDRGATVRQGELVEDLMLVRDGLMSEEDADMRQEAIDMYKRSQDVGPF